MLGRGSNGIVYAGNWRGLPVAVKTIVFEAWEGGGEEEAGAARGPSTAGKARLRFVRAVMETAISASVGHRHVVRVGRARTRPGLLASPHSVRKASPICKWTGQPRDVLQVATYCFDIKRVDDDVSSSKATQGLQVLAPRALRHA